MTIFGMVVVFLLSISLCLGAYGFVLQTLFDRKESDYSRVRRETRRDMGVELCQNSYWFSESPDTVDAIQTLGSALRDNGSCDISQVRDKWRGRIKNELP